MTNYFVLERFPYVPVSYDPDDVTLFGLPDMRSDIVPYLGLKSASYSEDDCINCDSPLFDLTNENEFIKLELLAFQASELVSEILKKEMFNFDKASLGHKLVDHVAEGPKKQVESPKRQTDSPKERSKEAKIY
ncbi:hypothetical protein GEMRC1_004096 [Eukaryota sp. GEM-RC1]